MKRTITFFLLCGVFALGALAQRPSVVISKASVDPVIDGIVDDVWGDAQAENNIDMPTLRDGEPTNPSLGASGETTWQGLWTYTGLYILLRVNDDDFYPHYEVSGSNSWEYDKPELYFDVNILLEDAGGPSTGEGHYQVAPPFTDGKNDGSKLACGFNGNSGDIVEYAAMVEGPNYLVEYFIPYSGLLDKDGYEVDLTGELGFDVTILDRDRGDADYSSAVWSNVGTNDGSWVNMDDCGIITLEGAGTGTYVDEISLQDGEITENNGKLQMVAAILPEDASNKTLNWSVERGTGKASIDKYGVVTGIMDGEITVRAEAADGSYVFATATVTISNQIVSMGEVNVIRNPNFDELNGDAPAEWGGWAGDQGALYPTVQNGIVVCTPVETENLWQYSFSQSGLTADPDIEYVFSFKAWADETRPFFVDFEDIEANNYNRYGASSDPIATDGRSEWAFDMTTEPTRYTFDVTFDQMVETTVQMVSFQLGTSGVVTYLDSMWLVSVDDLEKVTEYIPVTDIVVSGADGATNVEPDATLQMSAAVYPEDADYKEIRWSVVDGSGSATIDAAGLLTGVTAGTVTVIASAVDDSYVSQELEITVGVGSGISPKGLTPLKVYPNPAVDQLIVELPGAFSTVRIYNSVGMLLDQVVVSGSKHVFDISSYAPGLYFVRTDAAMARFVK